MRFRLRTLLRSLLTWFCGKQSTESAIKQEVGSFERLEGRFTDRVRKVMSLSNAEAAKLDHEYIGPEHVLLAVLDEGTGVAALVLKQLSGDVSKIRAAMERYIIRGPKPQHVFSVRPMTPRAIRIVESAKEEAANLNHDFIGTEHILLSLMREVDSLPVQVLLNMGIDNTVVRNGVRSVLGIKS
jgi:ATP-dependent Clp protease ATP-binding subunit ClpC